MKLIAVIILLAISIHTSANSIEPRLFYPATANGASFDLNDLEMDLSRIASMMNGRRVDVAVTSLETPYSPMRYVLDYQSNSQSYVINLVLNRIHQVSCYFVFGANSNFIYMHDCVSETADVSEFGAVVYYENIGLPKTSNSKKEKFN